MAFNRAGGTLNRRTDSVDAAPGFCFLYPQVSEFTRVSRIINRTTVLLRATSSFLFQFFPIRDSFPAVNPCFKMMNRFPARLGVLLLATGNLVAAELPSGDGIAKSFKNDTDIESHSAVIFSENFESENFRER